MTNQARILLNGLARSGVGIAAITKPVPIIRLAGVDRVTAEKIAWLARLAGIRDLALGLGLLHAHATSGPTWPWLAAALFADAGDTAALTHAAAGRNLPAATAVSMIAATVGGVALSASALAAGRSGDTAEVEQTGQPPR